MGILRRIFGPSKDEVWKQFADEVGGIFIKGGFWTGNAKVRAKVNEWTLVLDLITFDGKIYYTRMRAPYINKDNFRFTIYHENIFSRLGKLFGLHDIQVGNPNLDELKPLFGVASYLSGKDIDLGYSNFDNEFIIKSNDEKKVKQLFENRKMRELILSIKYIHLEILDDEKGYGNKKFPENLNELVYQVAGEIKDLEQLKLIYELFAETLNNLCHIDSAYEEDPKLLLE